MTEKNEAAAMLADAQARFYESHLPGAKADGLWGAYTFWKGAALASRNLARKLRGEDDEQACA